MKMKSAVDLWINLAIWSVVILIMFSSFWVPRDEVIFFIMIGIPMICFLCWIYFGTYYELREDELFCKSGPFFEKIKYENIKSAKLVTNFLSSMALSIQRIEICQHHKGFITGTTMISPKNRELFLQELLKRCKNLEESPYKKD